MIDQGAGQFRWQSCSLGLLLWPGGFLFIGHRLIQLDLDGGKAATPVHRTTALKRVQLLTAAGKLEA